MYAYFPMNYSEFDDGELLHFASRRSLLDPEARRCLETELENRGLSVASGSSSLSSRVAVHSSSAVSGQTAVNSSELEMQWYS